RSRKDAGSDWELWSKGEATHVEKKREAQRTGVIGRRISFLCTAPGFARPPLARRKSADLCSRIQPSRNRRCGYGEGHRISSAVRRRGQISCHQWLRTIATVSISSNASRQVQNPTPKYHRISVPGTSTVLEDDRFIRIIRTIELHVWHLPRQQADVAKAASW